MKHKNLKADIRRRRQRITLLAGGTIVILLLCCLSLVFSLFKPNLSSFKGEEYPDDFGLTATALIGQLTEDARLVQMTKEKEIDSIQKTQAFLGTDTITPVPTSNSVEPDDFSLTATALIGQLTKDGTVNVSD